MATLLRSAEGPASAAKALREFAEKFPDSPHAKKCVEEALDQFVKAGDYEGAAREFAAWQDRLPDTCHAFLSSLGGVSGTARNVEGRLAPKAKVRLGLPDRNEFLETVSDEKARFRFTNLPAGAYRYLAVVPAPSSPVPMAHFVRLEFPVAGGGKDTIVNWDPAPRKAPAPPAPKPLPDPRFADGKERACWFPLVLRETTGTDWPRELVTWSVPTAEACSPGSVRVLDPNGQEILCQVSEADAKGFKVSFFAELKAGETRAYHCYFDKGEFEAPQFLSSLSVQPQPAKDSHQVRGRPRRWAMEVAYLGTMAGRGLWRGKTQSMPGMSM
jgi:hypothetical protein